jgi:hypothetical protein
LTPTTRTSAASIPSKKRSALRSSITARRCTIRGRTKSTPP